MAGGLLLTAAGLATEGNKGSVTRRVSQPVEVAAPNTIESTTTSTTAPEHETTSTKESTTTIAKITAQAPAITPAPTSPNVVVNTLPASPTTTTTNTETGSTYLIPPITVEIAPGTSIARNPENTTTTTEAPTSKTLEAPSTTTTSEPATTTSMPEVPTPTLVPAPGSVVEQQHQ